MKITFIFDSFDELTKYHNDLVQQALKGMGYVKLSDPEAAVRLAEAAGKSKAEEKKAKTRTAEEIINKAEPVAEKEIKAAEDKKAEEPAKVDEAYRIEVRQVLAQLNKKTGENTASKLIKELGVNKLTEVALDDLPGLMAKAKEVLDA